MVVVFVLCVNTVNLEIWLRVGTRYEWEPQSWIWIGVPSHHRPHKDSTTLLHHTGHERRRTCGWYINHGGGRCTLYEYVDLDSGATWWYLTVVGCQNGQLVGRRTVRHRSACSQFATGHINDKDWSCGVCGIGQGVEDWIGLGHVCIGVLSGNEPD